MTIAKAVGVAIVRSSACRFDASLLVLAMGLGCLTWGGAALAQPIRFEAEVGSIETASPSNTRVRSSGSASGGQYVGNFPNQDTVVDRLTVSASIPEGLYDLYIGYRSPFGPKGYELLVGDEGASGMFQQSSPFAQHHGGRFFVDTPSIDVRISESWGYYDIDYFEFHPAEARQPLPVVPAFSVPAPSGSSRYLLRYLSQSYGNTTLFGHQRENGNPNGILTPGVLAHTGGVMPAMIGSDLMRYSPSRTARGDNPNGESERMIEWAQQTGGIVTMMWHWNAPTDLIDQPGREWWRGFYSDATTFDLAAALADKDSPEYALLLRDIDVAAAELTKFRDAGVPVLWRPLHEAQGNDSGAWFWWGDSGPEALKELWGLMHDRMTNHHGLDNLLWVSTVQVEATDWQAWYPGDDQVDVVGVDIYSDNPSNNMSGQWLELLDEFDGRKLIALTETGSLPPETVLEQHGVAFSYMVPWSESFLTNDQSAAEVQQIIGDEDVVVLDDLAVTPWRSLAGAAPGDFDGDGLVTLADLAVWRDHSGIEASGPADANGDGRVDAADYTVWRDAYGSGPTRAVPEATAAMLVTGLLMITSQAETPRQIRAGHHRSPPADQR